ncbi:MAG TPA: CinA family protein [Micropepsaceae bacterium]|nr:CinA family protein [Micropepsaceae bacterium]
MPSKALPCFPPGLSAQANRIVKLLREHSLTVVTAESCTAGLIAALLSKPEGASDVLHGGFVTYSKVQKSRVLGVLAALLKRDGSVTAKVASEMASGALRRSPADIALAVTGVLGPAPDEDGNPVGLVYFACVRRGHKPRALRRKFVKRDHDTLCAATIRTAFELLEDVVSSS